jgi:ketopantoate reductase
MADTKKTVLIVGGGAVGAIAAVNLEVGGLATVTVVLRSNYNVVNEKGYTIESCDHGVLDGWKPSVGRLQSVVVMTEVNIIKSATPFPI